MIPIVIIVLIYGFVIACMGGSNTQRYYDTINVEYRFSGTAEGVSIVYTNEDGGTEMIDKIKNNQSVYISNFPADKFLYLSVQNATDSGSVQAAIIVNDKVWKSAESKGAYVIASVSGCYWMED